MRPLPRWATLPLMAVPVGAWGLGLGDIELQSALNQPFRAEIEITATAEELDSLEVQLASQEAFDRYGLFRARFLTSLDFEITRDAAGRSILVVTSDRSITEPFVTLLLEASWARGRLLREYTALLDPPTMLPGPEGPVPVATPEVGETGERVAGGPIERAPEPAASEAPRAGEPAPRAAEPEPADGPAPVEEEPELAEAAEPVDEPEPAGRAERPQAAEPGGSPEAAEAPGRTLESASPGTYGPVQRGETLWAIADEFRPSGVSMHQMLVGLYRVNPEAFMGNMNLLRAGAILRIPGSGELRSVSAANAAAEFAEQTAEWRAGTGSQQLGGPSGESQARLRLVPPSEDRASAGPGAGGTGSDAAATAEAQAEVADLRGEVDSLESELEERDRIIELRDEQLAELQSRLADLDQSGAPPADGALSADGPAGGAPAESESLGGVENDGADADTVAAASELDSGVSADEDSPFVADAANAPAVPSGGAEPAASGDAPEAAGSSDASAASSDAPAASAAAATDPPSLVSQALDWLGRPLVWIGLGVAAVLLAGLSYVRRRRAEIDDVTGQWQAFEAELEAEDTAEGTAETAETAPTSQRLRAASAAEPFVVEETEAGRQTGGFGALDESTPRESAAQSGAADEQSADETLSSPTVMNLDQADPVAEADFHMAYGLYDQAADLMTKALDNDPGNRAYKLKLLEVYFVWGNKESFLETAKNLRADMGTEADADWSKVVIMGKQVCPDEAMFADAQAGSAGEVDLDLEAGEPGGLDLAFGDESAAAMDESAIDEIFGSTNAGDLALESGAQNEPSKPRDGSGGDDMLELGATTAAGLETAFADTSGESESTSADGLESTQESPTVEQPGVGGDDEWLVTTVESPTLTSERVAQGGGADTFDEDTAESPTIEQPAAYDSSSTVSLESTDTRWAAAGEQPGADQTSRLEGGGQAPAGGGTGEYTAELDLDDLGLDVSDFDKLPDDLGETPAAASTESDTREQPAVNPDDDDQLLSATGVTQVLADDESEFDSANTAVLGDDDQTMMAHVGVSAAGGESAGNGLDFDLGEGDTVEQPQMRSSEADGDGIFSGGSETPLDLDVGGDARVDDEPTDRSAAQSEEQTMTEVGTKLDLARAYIDMGDPEGARSILEEVLDEGDSGQRNEAQTLLDALSA